MFLKILEPLYPWLQEIKKSSQDQLEQTDASGDDGDDKKTDSKCDEKKDVDTETDQESKNNSDRLKKVKCRNAKESQHLEILYQIIQGFVYDYMFTLQMVNIKYIIELTGLSIRGGTRYFYQPKMVFDTSSF